MHGPVVALCLNFSEARFIKERAGADDYLVISRQRGIQGAPDLQRLRFLFLELLRWRFKIVIEILKPREGFQRTLRDKANGRVRIVERLRKEWCLPVLTGGKLRRLPTKTVGRQRPLSRIPGKQRLYR